MAGFSRRVYPSPSNNYRTAKNINKIDEDWKDYTDP